MSVIFSLLGSIVSNHSIRTDIQGLRAIAVLAVIFFHAFPSVLPGGYVGVDIFFVISGYVITRSIDRAKAAGQFTIAGFYRQRVRRIFPALYAVMFATLAASCFLLSPTDLKETAKTAAATALFGSNILFANLAHYFDGHSELKPLLHTWSLSVEEQFYIFFPLLFIFTARYSDRIKYTLYGAICLASLAWATRTAVTDSTPAFYLMPYRAWELLMGCILAMSQQRLRGTPKARKPMAIAGSLLIVLPMFAYDGTTVFPGATALLPCLGAVMIIYSCALDDNPIARFLSKKPLQIAGNLSYSLYLWHWPVLSLMRHYYGLELTASQSIAMLAATSALSYLSFKTIESPWLTDGRKSLPYLRIGTGSIVAALGLTGLLFMLKGVPQRFDASALSAF